MAIRTERITNPDGTVTVRKTSGRNVKHEADWGDGPHPDEKPHTGSSALDRKWEKAEKDRKRRLLGHDGGPKEGDVRSSNDESLAKAAERRRRMRVLRGDPAGTSSQAGTQRAEWLLTESKNKDELKAWLEGATGDRPDLWNEDYRSEDRERLTYERSAEAGGEDWEKWSGDFKGFTGSDPTGTWADDRQTITAAEEGYEKDEERYRTDFRELTGQDSTGEPDRDQMLINFYERRNLGLAKSTDPITGAEREAALAEIAKKLERYRTEFRAFAGQDSTGDSDQDQLIINFYTRRNLGLPKSTDPITEAERESALAEIAKKQERYRTEFRAFAGQDSTGDSDQDQLIINFYERRNLGLPKSTDPITEAERESLPNAPRQGDGLLADDDSTASPNPGGVVENRGEIEAWAKESGLRLTDADFQDVAALQEKMDVFNAGQQLYRDQVKAADRRRLEEWAKDNGLHLTDADFEDPIALQRKIDKFTAGKQGYADLVEAARKKAQAQDLAARVALSQSGIVPVPSSAGPERFDPAGFGPDGGWVLGVGGPRRNDVEGFDTGQPGGWVPGSPNVLQRTNDPLASVTGDGLDAFAEQYPVINIDGNPQPTRELLELNRVTTETGLRQGGPRRDDHTGFHGDRLAAYLNKLALEGRASTTGETPFIPLDAQRRTTPRVYNAAGNLRPLSQGDYRTGNTFTTEDGFTGTAHQIRRRADEQLTSRDRLVLAGEGSRILTLPAKDIGARTESSPGGQLYLSGEGVSGGDLAWAGVEAGAVYAPQLAVGAVRGGPQAWGQLKRAFPGETPAQAAVRAAELQQHTLAWQSAQAAANPLRGRVVTMYSTPSEGIESAIIRLPDGSHRILEGPFKPPPPGAGTWPPAPGTRQSILDQRYGPYSTYVDPGTNYRVTPVLDPPVRLTGDFPSPPPLELSPRGPVGWDDFGQSYYVPDSPTIISPGDPRFPRPVRTTPAPGWKPKVVDDAGVIYVKDESLWTPPGRTRQTNFAVQAAPAVLIHPTQVPGSSPASAPGEGPSPVAALSPAPSPSLASFTEGAPAPAPQQVRVPETPPQLRQAPAPDTSVLRGTQTVPQPVPVTPNLSAPAPNIQPVPAPALETMDLTAPGPAPDPVPEPDPITAPAPIPEPVPAPSWPPGGTAEGLGGNRPRRRPPRPLLPDVIGPSFGEGGYSGLDGHPRVVAFTKTVEVQTALNDGDSMETPVQVGNFRVIATGRRRHPEKLLEGRHVDVKTDAGGNPAPVRKPPTRGRRRNLNRPPLAPQSRRKSQGSNSPKGGIRLLRGVGPRIGRRR